MRHANGRSMAKSWNLRLLRHFAAQRCRPPWRPRATRRRARPAHCAESLRRFSPSKRMLALEIVRRSEAHGFGSGPRRHGAYGVVAATGLILKRGHDLGRVLGVLERAPRLAAV